MLDKIKLSKKQKAILKSYFRGVLVSFLTFLASNQLGFEPVVSVLVASVAGPAAKALDKNETEYGVGAVE
jgi:hypothetical protein